MVRRSHMQKGEGVKYLPRRRSLPSHLQILVTSDFHEESHAMRFYSVWEMKLQNKIAVSLFNYWTFQFS